MKTLIVYWSGTGNTEEMAKLVEKGSKESGADVTLKPVSDATAEEINDYDTIILGCSSMGDEVLEESEFEPYMESIEGIIKGKKIGLFGSYGWGDGKWMRDWEERVSGLGGNMPYEYVITTNAPEGDAVEACIALGRNLSK